MYLFLRIFACFHNTIKIIGQEYQSAIISFCNQSRQIESVWHYWTSNSRRRISVLNPIYFIMLIITIKPNWREVKGVHHWTFWESNSRTPKLLKRLARYWLAWSRLHECSTSHNNTPRNHIWSKMHGQHLFIICYKLCKCGINKTTRCWSPTTMTSLHKWQNQTSTKITTGRILPLSHFVLKNGDHYQGFRQQFRGNVH